MEEKKEKNIKAIFGRILILHEIASSWIKPTIVAAPPTFFHEDANDTMEV